MESQLAIFDRMSAVPVNGDDENIRNNFLICKPCAKVYDIRVKFKIESNNVVEICAFDQDNNIY